MQLYFPALLTVLMLLPACAPEPASTGENIPGAEYSYSPPAITNTPLTVSSLVQESFTEMAITDIVRDILDNRYGGIDSLLIAKNGSLVLEEYFNGYHRNKRHDIRSATKSITGLLTGIAIDKGHIPGVDAPVYEYFPRYDHFDYWDDLKNDITVQHLLTMSGGWECNDWENSSQGNEERMYRYEDWARFILDLPMVNIPGSVFSYCTGGAALLGDITEVASAADFSDFAKQHLFAPLGITQFHYRYDPTGRTHVGGQMHLTPLGMLKIGQLFLDDGAWGGEQIISSQWIAASKTPYFSWYSNLWWIWLGTIEATGEEVTIHYASGNGGQYIFVIPAHDLVVVFTSHEYNKPEASNGFRILLNRIIPAIN